MGGLIALYAFLGAACLCFLAKAHFLNRRIRKVTEQVNDFLSGNQRLLEVALEEDPFADLQNGVADLQQLLKRERLLKIEECSRTSQLTADISHQLKTPLSTLRLYTEMDNAPHMDACLEQIQRMENLISSLLRLERLCANGYPFTFAQANAEEIIQDQWLSLQPLWPGKILHMEGTAKIRCDAQWLGEAFLNLLKNACEHTPEQGEIWVKIERTDAVFFCTIEDNGGGVSTECLSKLLQRFYRAEHQSQNGAGIGLAIVKEIIERHHSTILAENGEKGLRIRISMPMLDGNLANS